MHRYVELNYRMTKTYVIAGLILFLDELEISNLDEADDDGNDHESVDDGVADVDDEHGDQMKVFLVDEGKVENEGDGERHQSQQT